MYGTIFRMKVKEGQSAVKPKVEAALGSFLLKPDNAPGELVGVAVFRDEAGYRSNAENPAQDIWYRRLRELLQEDPEWQDGEYLIGSMD